MVEDHLVLGPLDDVLVHARLSHQPVDTDKLVRQKQQQQQQPENTDTLEESNCAIDRGENRKNLSEFEFLRETDWPIS
jgi:hypothetical protein